ncbi:aquaporin [Paenarthrobacter sp. Z7-10]|uniref:aquaporin n=1 Tax=Paenarthrobacter sp. Z7-10 TaxID=2787635 RepID=UPI0022A8FCFE|nr:aquaporin [Paenarthrobacter sp. Z7-10]MCZ2404800.1 aquaporin [Paenarthrobacter sp. Z7-10]
MFQIRVSAKDAISAAHVSGIGKIRSTVLGPWAALGGRRSAPAGGAVNPDRALGPAIMSGTYDSLWIYVLADILGGILAALLYTKVVSKATAPTMEHGDPQGGKSAGDRGLATGHDTDVGSEG